MANAGLGGVGQMRPDFEQPCVLLHSRRKIGPQVSGCSRPRTERMQLRNHCKEHAHCTADCARRTERLHYNRRLKRRC